MIASLPMYWRPENAGLWRDFWRCVQARGRNHGLNLPDLTPPEDIAAPWTDHWLSPDLVLSQTCGLPFRAALKGKVRYVGTLDFGLDGKPGDYHSRLIARPDFDGQTPCRLAYNAADSQSGWAARFDTGPDTPHLSVSDIVETGSHAASLAAVAEGRADAAYIDAVTWRILKRVEPNAKRVRAVGRTSPAPGLPLITAKHIDPEPLRLTLRDAIAEHAFADPTLVGGLRGFVVIPEAAYYALPVPPAPGQPPDHLPESWA